MRQRLAGRPLQRAIIQEARRFGWRVAHFPSVETTTGWRTPVAADGKGFPDLVLVRERVLVIEVKGDGDTLKPEQRTWLAAFAIAGVEALVASPRDWESGELLDVLKARRSKPVEGQTTLVTEALRGG